ncbi:MAG: chorismate synthase [Bacteroidia bacterium]|jgi:chorismate synthase|nr:chorismate synthase [Bacteroidia bacterium]
MAGNTFGTLLRLTTYGESHGPAVGGILDGLPAGVEIDTGFIQHEMSRRRPGQSRIVTQRREDDELELLSGIFEGKSTGSPIGFMVRSEDSRPRDYDALKEVYRPSHADYTWEAKYGIRDHRGGGRSSARETVARVAGGALAKLFLRTQKIQVQAYVSQVGAIALQQPWHELDLSQTESNIVRCPDADTAEQMIRLIESIRKQGDTIGGIITCVITGVPPGIGEPVFDKLHADLGKAMLSINAVKGVEFGSGFASVALTGSQHNDAFLPGNAERKVITATNRSGGIQGGISNGEAIYFRTAFKPVATIMQKQRTVNTAGKAVEVMGRGRHDPCVVPRAVPIVEAMSALVVADHLLRQRGSIV